MDGESRGNAGGSADENGEELVEVVVLGDNHGEHDHFDGTVLVFEVYVADGTVHQMGLLMQLVTLFFLDVGADDVPCGLLVDSPGFDLFDAHHDRGIERYCVFARSLDLFQLEVSRTPQSAQIYSCNPFLRKFGTSFSLLDLYQNMWRLRTLH